MNAYMKTICTNRLLVLHASLSSIKMYRFYIKLWWKYAPFPQLFFTECQAEPSRFFFEWKRLTKHLVFS